MQTAKGRKKLIRVTTVPVSLKVLLKNQLHFMTQHFDVVAVSSPGSELEDVERNENVRTVAVPMSRSLTPVADVVSLWRLYRLFRKEKPDIVHTHTPKAGLLGMLAAKMSGVPIKMHTVAGLPLMVTRGWKKKLLAFTEYITCKCADRVYPNSIALSTYIAAEKFCPPSKLKVLGDGSTNGISTAYFSSTYQTEQEALKMRSKFQLDEHDFIFIFIGRLVKDKGIEELVDAFVRLCSQNVHLRLLLVGDYEDKLDPVAPETRHLIEKHPAIVHTGFQQDVRPFLQLAHALVFPSYREGFPNVPMQAGCMDVPAIVTDINGCNEIIHHEKNGLIVPVRDAAALENAMQRLIADYDLYKKLRSNARSMIVEKFEQQRIWDLLLHEYQEMINHGTVREVYQAISGSVV